MHRCTILEETVKAVGGFDDAKMAEYLHKTTFKTIVGDIKFGPHGEWETARIITVQYQNIKGNDVQQFKESPASKSSCTRRNISQAI